MTLSASVVINTYGRQAILKRVLNCLRWQSIENLEVVVVVGPTRDGSYSMVKECYPSLRLVRADERNLSKSRNIGICNATGDVIAFLDDDAFPMPDWLEQLLSVYEDENVAAVGG
jgi:glycogen(starch) synthase